MRSRFRLFAALLALLALTTSVVEQAWAAACVGMDGPAAVTAAAPDLRSPPSAHVVDGHDSSAPDDHRGHAPADPASCPMAAASGMACGAAAVPMSAASALLAFEIQTVVLPATEQAPGSLALSSLFRPPRR